MVDNVLKLDFVRSENGGFLVREVNKSSGLMGKDESKNFTFGTFAELSSWLKTKLGV